MTKIRDIKDKHSVLFFSQATMLQNIWITQFFSPFSAIDTLVPARPAEGL